MRLLLGWLLGRVFSLGKALKQFQIYTAKGMGLRLFASCSDALAIVWFAWSLCVGRAHNRMFRGRFCACIGVGLCRRDAVAYV
jgi:uncharacterized membrane protein YhaH (DUF805 family)